MTARHACTRLVVRPLVPLFPFFLIAALLLPAGCGKPAPIVIGGLVSESGDAGAYGQQAKKGMELALEEANAQGGFPKGRELMVEFRDDASSPEKAKELALALATQNKVNILIGAVTSAVAEGVMPIVIEREMLLLSPTASSARLTGIGGGWFYRTYPSDSAEVRELADLLNKLDIDQVAVCAQNEAFGQALAEGFQTQYELMNGHIALRKNFELPLDPPTAEALAKELVAAKVPAVYLAAWEDQVALLLQALSKAGYQGLKLAPSSVTPKIIRLSGPAAERLVFPQAAFNLDDTTPQVKAFIDAYQKKYNEAPTVWAAYGYDAMTVLAAALRKTTMATAGEVRSALLESQHAGVTGEITFDSRGDVARLAHLYAVRSGETLHIDAIDQSLRGILLP